LTYWSLLSHKSLLFNITNERKTIMKNQLKPLIKLASQRTSIPVLNMIFVQNGIAQASDCDTFIRVKTDLFDGSYNAKELKAGVIKNWPDFAPSDYPLAFDKGAPVFTSSELFTRDSFEYLANHMCEDDSRFYLMGIHINTEHCVATNGHTMAVYNHSVKIPDGFNAIMPAEMVDIILSLWEKKDSAGPRITFYKSHVTAEINGYVIECKLIDGNFPDYLRIIPNIDNMTKVKWDNESNLAAIKTATKQAGLVNKTYAIKLSKNSVSTQYGNQTIVFDCPDNFKIGFNGKYFLATMLLGDIYIPGSRSGPSMFESGPYKGIIMPLRV